MAAGRVRVTLARDAVPDKCHDDEFRPWIERGALAARIVSCTADELTRFDAHRAIVFAYLQRPWACPAGWDPWADLRMLDARYEESVGARNADVEALFERVQREALPLQRLTWFHAFWVTCSPAALQSAFAAPWLARSWELVADDYPSLARIVIDDATGFGLGGTTGAFLARAVATAAGGAAFRAGMRAFLAHRDPAVWGPLMLAVDPLRSKVLKRVLAALPRIARAPRGLRLLILFTPMPAAAAVVAELAATAAEEAFAPRRAALVAAAELVLRRTRPLEEAAARATLGKPAAVADDDDDAALEKTVLAVL